MKDKSKILPRVIIVVLIIALISTLVLSSVYAKYVSKKDPGEVNSRPAAFELIMKTPLKDSIDYNFAADGEPGTPIGHTETAKYYDFKVKTSGSEIRAEYTLMINFSKKLQDLIKKGREDKMKYGVACDFDVQQKNAAGNYVSILKDETKARDTVLNDGKWMYSATIEANKNPDPAIIEGEVEYRLVMIVYNNTMMPEDGNTLNYVLSTNGIEISVASKQDNPNYKGQYAGS